MHAIGSESTVIALCACACSLQYFETLFQNLNHKKMVKLGKTVYMHIYLYTVNMLDICIDTIIAHITNACT